MDFQIWLNEQEKAWKAEKAEFMRFWSRLRSDVPIAASPIPAGFKGSTYTQDAIRVTGSPDFINSVLGRLKDFILYQTPSIKLDAEYRQAKDVEGNPIAGRYAAYIKLRQIDANI